MNNQKYFGILKDFDTEKVDEKAFNYLIEKKIIVFDYDLSGEELEDEIKYQLENPNEIFSLNSFWYCMFEKSYGFNDDIYKEMYEKDNYLIEYFSDSEKNTLKIETEIEKEINVQSQIQITEYYHDKYFNLIKNNTEENLISNYLLFKNGTRYFGYKNWFEIYKENIVGSGKMTPLIDFLKGKDYFYNKDMKEEWELIYSVSKVCDFCKSKRQQLVNPNFENEIVKESKAIFKDDGYKIFCFLVSKHTGIKNKAFFSYLYSYLSADKKIIGYFKKDNKPYREFIENNFNIKMAKIIETVSNEQNKKGEILETFSNHMETYSEKC